MPDKLRSEHHRKRLLHEVERRHREESSFGERVADKVNNWLATWTFLGIVVVVNGIWIWLNARGHSFDPPPYGNLTLGLSIASLEISGLILISQKRSSSRDSLTLEHAAHESEEDRKETEGLRTELSEMRRELREVRQLTQDQTRLLQTTVGVIAKGGGRA